MSKVVIPGLTRNPVLSWIPASSEMTKLKYMIAGLIKQEHNRNTPFNHIAFLLMVDATFHINKNENPMT